MLPFNAQIARSQRRGDTFPPAPPLPEVILLCQRAKEMQQIEATCQLPYFSLKTVQPMGSTSVTGSSTATSFTTKTYNYYVPPVTYHPETFVMSFLGTKDYINRKPLERYHSESHYNSDEWNVLTWAPEHFQKMLEVFQKSPSEQTGYLGIAFNTESSQPVVYDIDPDGPAKRLTFYLSGKKVVKINNLNIRYRTQLHRIIKKSKPGTEIILSVETKNGTLENYKIIVKSIPFGYQTQLPYF
jgi:hypothetical protein